MFCCFRRCNSSNDELHHLTSVIHQLQSQSADVQEQLVTAADNQQDAATQASQVLDISKHLQVSGAVNKPALAPATDP